MSRPGTFRLGAGVLGVCALAAVFAGCGSPPEAGTEVGTEVGTEPVDSSLVDLLADLALADARAATAPSAPRAADSLRTVALAAHGVSADEARRRQDALAADAAVARATYDAVERALAAARTPP